MNSKELNTKLVALGFKAFSTTESIIDIDGYKITVKLDDSDVSKSIIDYGSGIKIWHKSSSRFHQDETIVVLECVIKLLRKGYPPNKIELEKTWPSGRGTSGRLDVLVKNPKKGVFAMIECKTWGGEYEKERNNLIEDGGQLFSYAVQERSTKYLSLYTSRITTDAEYQSECIDLSSLSGTSNIELHQSWDKNFVTGGIFATAASCYNIANIEIKKKDLKELDHDSGRGMFHSFAEILRRHAVSDKSNAFNKIFNLFVCKIYDEDTHAENDILDFQWKPSDDYKKLIERLSKLYQNGIVDYLQLPIEDDYFSPYSEFSFVDIYNKESYNNNFKIVREIVELLQRYQIKYTQKHQFLGDFFEDLLNSGIKQEAGQFFTPTPLARFFTRAMPITKLVNDSIDNKSQHVIPSVIDFACGAGHFLTEAIDEIEGVIRSTDYKRMIGRAQKHFIAIRDNYYWAKDYIYGIEKDYRLSKTTKIAMFLNGDGDAVIVNSDGLGSFSNDSTFRDLLKSDKHTKELGNFDILVSNPPFSISGFAKDLKHGNTDFDLFDKVTQKSSEIECLFLERAYQLLKEGGYLGLILPLSILNNENSVYIGARRIMLLGFQLVGLIELRDKTFKPTNTTTVSVFARKRDKRELNNAAKELQRLLAGKKSSDLSDIAAYIGAEPKLLKEKVSENTTYLNKLGGKETLASILKLDDIVFSALLYRLDKHTKLYIGYSGEKKDQEHFLGYRFSKSRGQEGVEILLDGNGKIDSRLYDELDCDNTQKVSYYIRNSFRRVYPPVHEVLNKNLKLENVTDLVSSNSSLIIDNPSKHFESRHISLESISPVGDFIDEFPQKSIKLRELRDNGLLFYTSGLTYSKKDSEVPYETSKRVLTASNISLQDGKIDLSTKLIYLRNEFVVPDEYQPKPNDIVISNASGSIKHLGKVAWVTKPLKDYAVGGFLGIYRFKDPAMAKAVYYRLMSKKFRSHVGGLRGQNINNLDFDKVDNCGIEIPTDLDKFIKEAEKRENA